MIQKVKIVKLVQNKDFLLAYRKGKIVFGKACTFYYRKNGKKINRLGLTTSKKIGNAVDRSRARRVMMTAYRKNVELLPVGYDFVIVAKEFATECKSDVITRFISDRVVSELRGKK